MNADPQNPANWQPLDNVEQGTDIAKRYEPDGNGGAVQVIYTRDWATGVWLRNGQPMGNEGLAMPCSSLVPFHDTSMTSTGTVKVRIQWINPNVPAPTKVRVTISAAAGASAYIGEPSADNGLGGLVVRNVWADQTEDVHCQGGILRTIEVGANGIAEYTISKSASANSISDLQGNCASSAQAEGGTMWVDYRTIVVAMLGVGNHYDRQVGGNSDPLYLDYDELTGAAWDRNLFLSQLPSYFTHHSTPYTYPSASQIGCPITFGSDSSNEATWPVGFPVVQQIWHDAYGNSYYDPDEIPFWIITMAGGASSKGIPVERYQWGGFDDELSGDLPIGDDWDIPNYTNGLGYFPTVHQVHRSYNNVGDPNNVTKSETKHFFGSLSAETKTITLEYTWADGIKGVAKRVLQFHHDVEETKQTDLAKLDWQINYQDIQANFGNALFEDGQDKKHASDSTPHNVKLGNSEPFEYRIIRIVGGTIATTADITGYFVEIPGGIEIAAISAAASALIFELLPEPAFASLGVSPGDQVPCEYLYPDPGQITPVWHDAMQVGSTMGDYDYNAAFHSRRELTPTYTDIWSLTGFISRAPGMKKEQEMPTSAPRILRFYMHGPILDTDPGGQG